jgi:hypothetical protein
MDFGLGRKVGEGVKGDRLNVKGGKPLIAAKKGTKNTKRDREWTRIRTANGHETKTEEPRMNTDLRG